MKITMKIPGKTSIRKRLTWVILLVSMISAGVPLIGFLLYERITYRELLANDLGTKAEIIAENINAALAFRDSVDATRVLGSLVSQPRVIIAAVYDENKALFTTYRRTDISLAVPATPEQPGWRYTDEALYLFGPIRLGQNEIGTLFIASDLVTQQKRRWSYIQMAGVLFITSFIVTMFIALRLERKISGPILDLADVAKQVSERHDYSIRANKTTEDETGFLADSVNEMLSNIQEQNADLRQKHNELELAEERYRSTLDNMLEGCQIISFDMKYVYVNDVAAKHGKATKQQLIGHTMAEVYPGIEHTHVYTQIKQCLEHRIPATMENEFTFPDGTTGWFELSIEPIPEGAFVLSTDISKEKSLNKELTEYREHLEDLVQKRTEQLEMTNKELEAFSYSISHDLRAPLRHIDGFAELLLKKTLASLDEQGKRYLDTISRSAKHMGALIDDLLVFSRMGRTELKKSSVNPTVLVRETIDNFIHETDGRDMRWTIHPLPVISADRNMLNLVFQNLIGNAIKYTGPRKHPTVEVGCTTNESEHVFYVRDNGVGFDMKYVDKLFGVFQRLHRADEFEGTGIGLANVRRIISRHGGKTWAEAVLDEGTTVYFTLPLGVSNGSSTISSSERA